VVPPVTDGVHGLSLVSNAHARIKVWDAESGVLHRELEPVAGFSVTALASFLSPDGQQPRLVAGSSIGDLRVYDPEAGSVLHRFKGYDCEITNLACIASSSAAPHHPRLVSTSWDGTAKVWDGETGERLADLRGHTGGMRAVAVWKEHTGGGEHDRIATTSGNGRIKVWDGETLTLLHDLQGGQAIREVSVFRSAEVSTRLLVGSEDPLGIQLWDPEEGRLLHDGINRGCPLDDLYLFESAQGRYLLATVGRGEQHPRHPGDEQDEMRAFLDVWDLGEAPARAESLRPAHKHG
jgi:WD40 repeat protein